MNEARYEMPHYAKQKEGTGINKTLGCFAIGCGSVLVLGILGIMLFFNIFKEEINAAKDMYSAAMKAEEIQQLSTKLSEDFPFDLESPGEIDADRLVRYRNIRDALSREFTPYFSRWIELYKWFDVQSTESRPNEEFTKEDKEKLLMLASTANESADSIISLATICRENSMSLEEFQYIAAQIWGNVALTVGNNDAETMAWIVEKYKQWIKISETEDEFDADPKLIANALIEKININTEILDSTDLQQLILDDWQYWEKSEDALLIIEILTMDAIEMYDSIEQDQSMNLDQTLEENNESEEDQPLIEE